MKYTIQLNCVWWWSIFVSEIIVYQLWLNIDVEIKKYLKILKYFSLFVSNTSMQNSLNNSNYDNNIASSMSLKLV